MESIASVSLMEQFILERALIVDSNLSFLTIILFRLLRSSKIAFIRCNTFLLRTCKTLDIVSTSLRRLLGQPPTTLQDFLNREVFPQSDHPAPRKIVKQNVEEQKPIKRQTKEIPTPHRDEPKS